MIALKSLWESISGARNAILAVLAAAGLSLPLGYCTGLRTANSANAAERLQASAKIRALESRLADAAARERLVDQVTLTRQEKELLDAVEKLPDAVPSARRVARACVQLRQAGTRDADLPAVCRPAGGDRAQAGAAGGDRDQ